MLTFWQTAQRQSIDIYIQFSFAFGKSALLYTFYLVFIYPIKFKLLHFGIQYVFIV